MNSDVDRLEERILRRIPVEIAAFSAFVAVPVALIFSPLDGVLFFAGGIVAALSFLWLRSALGRILARARPRAFRSGIALYAVRLTLILGVFFLIMLAYPKKILAFSAGFSTILPVFFVEAAVALARMKSWKV
jgi:hypothetical protein